MLTQRAYAKVNLGLEIVGRRADGYHDVVTILQQIDLFDTLTFSPADELSVTSSDPSLDAATNLSLRAACRLADVAHASRGAAIHQTKRIPVAAGLGGGSSDAAATLVGLNRLWDLDLALDALAEIGTELGSDVPFFLRGGTQLATGRGDELQPLPTPRAFVIVLPGQGHVAGKTSRLYAALCPSDFSDGAAVHRTASRLEKGDGALPTGLINSFERAAGELFSSTPRLFEAVVRAGGVPLLAGAGPSVASIHRDGLEARSVADRLRADGFGPIVARTLAARPASPPRPLSDPQMERGRGGGAG